MVALLCLVTVSCEKIEDVDLNAPAPKHEIDLANEYMSSRLGARLFEEAMFLVESKGRQSNTAEFGYLVCYRFFPPASSGVYVKMCVERYPGDASYRSIGGEIPNCADYPGRCRGEVGTAEALQLALDNGLRGGLANAAIRLSLVEGHDSLVWQVFEGPAHLVADKSHPAEYQSFIINRVTGEVEVRTKTYR